jgi:uncharacterized protein YcbK (DUF882 family)
LISPCNRRHFLKISAGAILTAATPLPAFCAAVRPGHTRGLSFFNTHTRESLDIRYFENGDYRPDALEQINTILRDHRTNQIHPMDPRLLDLLYMVKTGIRSRSPFHVISGYRSPATNEMLRKSSNGVARTSYHLLGKAIDIRLPGYGSDRLRSRFARLRSGGVGYYPKSDFVHVDTGPVRQW